MSSTEIQEPTPSQVADLANQKVKLPRLALIGIFGSQTAPAALIRDATGVIQRVTPGDTVAGRQVEAIGEDRVILSRGTRIDTLTLPST